MEVGKFLFLKEDSTSKWLKHYDFKVSQLQADILFVWQELLINKIHDAGCTVEQATKRIQTFNQGVTDYFLTNFTVKRTYAKLVEVYNRTQTVKRYGVTEDDAKCELRRREREWKKLMKDLDDLKLE